MPATGKVRRDQAAPARLVLQCVENILGLRRAVRAGLVTTFYTYPEPRPIRVHNPASQPSRRAVAGLMQIKVTAPALPRALSRLAAAPYDGCEKRAGRVNGLAFTELWE